MSEPLKRLIILIIESGTAVAIVQIAGYAFFRIFESSNIPTGLAMCLPSVYTLTMLFNLNIRETLRRAIHARALDARPRVRDRAVVDLEDEKLGTTSKRRITRTDSGQVNSSQTRHSIVSAIYVSRTESQVIEEGDDFSVTRAPASRVEPSRPTVERNSSTFDIIEPVLSPAEKATADDVV
ncbi:hypothetical protein OIO90_004226 [Microbotryomycetes sp. JL221]|nr:hypothetical protein OIO90_004226 [Microbotryomycetes sp. JL221]